MVHVLQQQFWVEATELCGLLLLALQLQCSVFKVIIAEGDAKIGEQVLWVLRTQRSHSRQAKLTATLMCEEVIAVQMGGGICCHVGK